MVCMPVIFANLTYYNWFYFMFLHAKCSVDGKEKGLFTRIIISKMHEMVYGPNL